MITFLLILIVVGMVAGSDGIRVVLSWFLLVGVVLGALWVLAVIVMLLRSVH